MLPDILPFSPSLTFCVKLIGPTLGFLLGSACLGTYVYPGQEVEIFNQSKVSQYANPKVDYDELDPRWIGAWWIGFPIIAGLLTLFSLPLIFFPQVNQLTFY